MSQSQDDKAKSRQSMSNCLIVYMGYLLAVVLFGMIVRATGSGDGCGNNWPLCEGQFVPYTQISKTWIEYSHRLSSGLTLPWAFGLYYYCRKIYSRGHLCRTFLLIAIGFLILEGLIGAALVRLEHVADNQSVYRGFSISIHLINTFFLMMFTTLSWFWSRYRQSMPMRSHVINGRLLGGIILIMLTGISGALTALGDTLFPPASAESALELAMMAGSHLWVKLRIYHPFIAIVASAYLMFFCYYSFLRLEDKKGFVYGFVTLLFLQLMLGFLNIKLMAPTWLQLVHLLMAHLIWMKFIVVGVVLNHKKQLNELEKLNH